MVSIMTVGLKIPGVIIPARTPWDYMEMYEQMDIVVIPLQDTPFNRMKSNLKILEAAAKRLPVVVPRVHPYLDFPEDIVCYVDSQGDWYRHMNRLVRDPEERKARGQMLHDYCRANYDVRQYSRYECFQRTILREQVLPLGGA
jgi:glycosyltransferase involved in cell wall biosynthesis